MHSFFTNDWVVIPLLIWAIFWKGCALWIASKNDHKKWFIALLLLNTFGLLDIFYIFHIAKKNLSDIKGLFCKKHCVKKESNDEVVEVEVVK